MVSDAVYGNQCLTTQRGRGGRLHDGGGLRGGQGVRNSVESQRICRLNGVTMQEGMVFGSSSR